jgi:hypothetical protein
MRTKIIALLSITISALVFTGCDAISEIGPKEANLLGVAKIQKAHYQPTGLAAFSLSTDELYSRKNFGGDQVSLLWGLITIKDY